MTGPAEAIPPGMTFALKATGSLTFDLNMKEKGNVIFVDHGSVSADGRMLTVDVINGPSGPAQDRTKLVYDRQH